MVLFQHGSYRTGFALLLVSALLTIAIVFVASNLFPNPRELEAGHSLETKGFSRSNWLYLVAGAFAAAGFADFSLIAYHFQRSGSVAGPVIPTYYAVAMALGGASASFSENGLIKLDYSSSLPPFSFPRFSRLSSSSASLGLSFAE